MIMSRRAHLERANGLKIVGNMLLWSAVSMVPTAMIQNSNNSLLGHKNMLGVGLAVAIGVVSAVSGIMARRDGVQYQQAVQQSLALEA